MIPAKRPAVRGLTAYLLLASSLLLIVMGKFLFFRAAYLYKDIGADSINIFYPQIRHLFAYLRTDGAPGWSFSQGLGQNIYPFSWNDPFYLILFLFRGGWLPFGVAYMEAAKLLSAGTLFYLYLRELSLKETASVAGALLFSFSGYIVLAGAWNVFSSEAVYCALLLYALERFLKRGSWALIPVPIALISLQQPALLFPYALFFAAYAAARFADEKGRDPRKLGAFLLRFAGAAALGAALAGVLLFSEIRQILESPRASGPSSAFKLLSSRPFFEIGGRKELLTALLRLYSNDLLGTGSGFRGWVNYLEAPLFYCGLVCLLLAPQAFAAMSRGRRRLYGALSALILLPVAFPFFRHAFWAFGGEYYRTLSLFAAVLLLFFSARALDRLEETGKLRRDVLAISLAAALALLYAASAVWKAPVDVARRNAVAALLAGHALLLFLMGRKKSARLAGTALIALIGFEAAWASWRTIDERDVLTASELASRSGYDDSTIDAVAYLKSIDPSFYRVEKNYRSNPTPYLGLNDAKAQGYYGTSSYASFNQMSYVSFLASVGLLDPANAPDAAWIRGLGARDKLMSLVGVKYFLAKGPGRPPPGFAAAPVGTLGNVRIFRSRRALPLGFGYDRCLPAADFAALGPQAKDAALLDAFVSDDADCLGFPRFSAPASPEGERRTDAAVRARRADALAIGAFSQNSIEGDVVLRKRKMLFFSIPYDAGWTARVDGKPAALKRADVGFLGLPLDAGAHRVELRFEPPLRRLGAIVTLAALALYGFLLFRPRRPARGDR